MDVISWDAAKFWLDVMQWVMTIAVSIALWVRTGRNQNRSAVEGLERRVLTIEEHLKHAPTHEDITRLQSQYAGLESKLDRVTNTLDRIHDYLMNKK